jgi:ERCC4-type nuclease
MSREALTSALASTRITSGFHVITTMSVDATVAQLARMHRAVERVTLGDAATVDADQRIDLAELLRRMPGDGKGVTVEAYSTATKTGTARTALETFGAQLRQIHGCSAARAEAILSSYPTPRALVAALGAPAGERAVARLVTPDSGRAVGPTVARLTAAVFRNA